MKATPETFQPSPSRWGAATIRLAAVMLIATAGATAGAATFIDIRTGPGPDDRIEGEAIAPGREGWIEVLSIGHSIDKGPNSSRSRRGVPTLGDVVVLKELDKSSTKLQEAAFTGQVFPELRVEFPLDGAEPGITFRLEDVIVTRYKTALRPGVAGGRPIEEVSFYYNKISWVYRPDPSGAPPVSAFSFDLLFGTGESDRDDDGDGIDNALDPDDDNDGIDDEYELENGLHPLLADGDYDDDGDGDSNYEEWLAGTVAYDANSKFSIHSISLDREGRVTVKVPTIGGRRYQLKGSFDLAQGRWLDLDRFETQPGTPSGMMELELPPGAAAQFDRLFFSVEVTLPVQ